MWLRSPRQVSLEEYQEFYRTTFRMYDEPLNHTHFSLEGQVRQAGTPPWPSHLLMMMRRRRRRPS